MRRKPRPKKKVIILVIVIIILLLKFMVYTPNYFWSKDLVEAVRDNNTEKVQELLNEEGMDIDKPGGSFLLGILFPSECGRETPLKAALINRNYELIRMLLDAGAAPVMRSENPICWIVATPYFGEEEYELVQLLVEKGADIDGDGRDGLNVPLLSVAICDPMGEDGSFDEEKADLILQLYQVLLEKATEKQPKNQYGETPLHYAASARNTALMAYLIEEQGYSVDIQTDTGMTPLMYAVNEYGSQDNLKETVWYLLNAGADIRIKDEEGMTARDYALQHGEAEIADTLEEGV